MPSCPYCSDDNYFLTEEELEAHIVKEHSQERDDYSPHGIARAFGDVMANQEVCRLAASLTMTSMESGKSVDEVFSVFEAFCEKLGLSPLSEDEGTASPAPND